MDLAAVLLSVYLFFLLLFTRLSATIQKLGGAVSAVCQRVGRFNYTCLSFETQGPLEKIALAYMSILPFLFPHAERVWRAEVSFKLRSQNTGVEVRRRWRQGRRRG